MRFSVIYFLFVFSSVKIREYLAKDKIVGGTRVNIKKFPYQVSLQYRSKHLCGGSIISSEWILSAAHCVHGRDYPKFSIRAGSTYHHKEGRIHKVTTIIPHNHYNTTTTDYDVAVIRVKPALTLGSPTVTSIKLSDQGFHMSPGDKAVVSGWGLFYFFGMFAISPRTLRAVTVPIVNRKECQKLLEPEIVTERMLCAGFIKGGKDACDGDSGGPLTLKGTQIGVVSWGVECGARKKPGVYADVSALREWIAGSSGV